VSRPIELRSKRRRKHSVIAGEHGDGQGGRPEFQAGRTSALLSIRTALESSDVFWVAKDQSLQPQPSQIIGHLTGRVMVAGGAQQVDNKRSEIAVAESRRSGAETR